MRSVSLLTLAAAACGTHSSSPAAGTFTPRAPGRADGRDVGRAEPGVLGGDARDDPTGGLEYELARDLAHRFGLRSVRIELVHFHRIVSGQLGGADLALDLITPTSRARAGPRLLLALPRRGSDGRCPQRHDRARPRLGPAAAVGRGPRDDVRRHHRRLDRSGRPDDDLRQHRRDARRRSSAARSTRCCSTCRWRWRPLTVRTAACTPSHSCPTHETIAAALPKGSNNTEAVDSAMRAFTADGTLHHLLETWVGSARSRRRVIDPAAAHDAVRSHG